MAKPPVILVADDDDSVRDMLNEQLSASGFVVIEAASTTDVQARLAETSVDLLLLDRTMPGGDSLRLVPELRRRYPALGIVVLTALVQDEERVRGLDTGADDYVGKPFQWRELIARLHAVLRRARREADKAEPSVGQRRSRRREAVILFADAAGFTRMVQEDERATLRLLSRCMRTVVAPGLAAHGGRLVKTLGDGFLAELPDAARAVECARDLQRVFRQRNAARKAERRLSFRIGIHRARVLVTADGDLLGDGVNLAARLQAEAEPGGIVVSEAIRTALSDATGLIALGARMLRHVADAQHLYAVADVPTESRGRSAGGAPRPRRLERQTDSAASDAAPMPACLDLHRAALYACAVEF